MTKAILKNHRQSPRKVRLVTDSIKGKKVEDAIVNLSVMPKRAADPILKLLNSAIANAKNNSVDTTGFVIKDITVNEGVTLKRFRPKWRGTAHPIRKRSSHIKIEIGTKEEKAKKAEKKAIKKTTVKTTKKAVTKKTVKKETKK